ncbi:uncharacterized protein RSE6_14791 [Rhynchosporium secalis]|uniref:BZIP domain-containing protein n=2 Tax=Rhynchosporium TaxID=38037 RepID=A0A1E1MW55_RHYSE|nr:uncharacterized protein RSE6_14791 [Rhynchosporium secalis]
MPRSSIHVSASTNSDSWQSDFWKVGDDWKEVDSKEEKKRRQNRINQRAYRRRNPTSEKSSKQRPFRVERFRIPELGIPKDRTHGAIIPKAPQSDPTDCDQIRNCADSMEAYETEALEVLTSPDEILDFSPICGTSDVNLSVQVAGPKKAGKELDGSIWDITGVSSAQTASEPWIKDPYTNRVSRAPFQSDAGHFHSRDPDGQALFRMSIEQLLSHSSPENTIINSYKTSINPNGFPLSSDHLLRLIHFNVFRGLITNKSILSGRTLQTRIHLDIALQDSRNLCDGLALIRSKPGEALPNALTPTYVQASIAHSSWFNMFPFPAIRDNLIKAEQNFNHEDLCFDLFGEMFHNGALEPILQEVQMVEEEYMDDVTAKRKGLILWGEPWDMNAWEVTPGFIKKWAWSLKNCHELIDSTNRWRSKRDEKPLAYPLFPVKF